MSITHEELEKAKAVASETLAAEMLKITSYWDKKYPLKITPKPPRTSAHFDELAHLRAAEMIENLKLAAMTPLTGRRYVGHVDVGPATPKKPKKTTPKWFEDIPE